MRTENYVGNNTVAVREDMPPTQIVAEADMISLETIVHVLVNKGLCSREELLELEQKIQQMQPASQQNSYINIRNNHDRGRFPGLKRSMSNHRWSRQLGTLLFGWKWKKVKKN